MEKTEFWSSLVEYIGAQLGYLVYSAGHVNTILLVQFQPGLQRVWPRHEYYGQNCLGLYNALVVPAFKKKMQITKLHHKVLKMEDAYQISMLPFGSGRVYYITEETQGSVIQKGRQIMYAVWFRMLSFTKERRRNGASKKY